MATLRKVQSLAGKLNFVCYTVRAGRVFLVKIFDFIKTFYGKPGAKQISESIKSDLQWWNSYLTEFNGVSMFPEDRWKFPDSELNTDSCLSGCRA